MNYLLNIYKFGQIYWVRNLTDTATKSLGLWGRGPPASFVKCIDILLYCNK